MCFVLVVYSESCRVGLIVIPVGNPPFPLQKARIDLYFFHARLFVQVCNIWLKYSSIL